MKQQLFRTWQEGETESEQLASTLRLPVETACVRNRCEALGSRVLSLAGAQLKEVPSEGRSGRRGEDEHTGSEPNDLFDCGGDEQVVNPLRRP